MANFLILRFVSSSAVSGNRELSRKCVTAIKSSSSSSGMSVVAVASSMVCEGDSVVVGSTVGLHSSVKLDSRQ